MGLTDEQRAFVEAFDPDTASALAAGRLRWIAGHGEGPTAAAASAKVHVLDERAAARRRREQSSDDGLKVGADRYRDRFGSDDGDAA